MTRDTSRPNTRRELLRLAALATLSFHGVRRSALAQGTSGVEPIKIGTIGAGRMGGTLGTLWVQAGHAVMFSSRDPEETKSLVERLGPLARVGTVDEAVTFGDVVLLAVPYSAYPELGKRHARALAGKLLVDVGNAFPPGMARLPQRRRRPGSASPRPNISPARLSCAPSTLLATVSFRGKRTGRENAWRSQSRATTLKHSRRPNSSCATPASIPL